jgi:hypothetical protein
MKSASYGAFFIESLRQRASKTLKNVARTIIGRFLICSKVGGVLRASILNLSVLVWFR